MKADIQDFLQVFLFLVLQVFMNVNVAEGVYISGEVWTLIFKVSRGWILMYFDSMTFILSTPAGEIST